MEGLSALLVRTVDDDVRFLGERIFTVVAVVAEHLSDECASGDLGEHGVLPVIRFELGERFGAAGRVGYDGHINCSVREGSGVGFGPGRCSNTGRDFCCAGLRHQAAPEVTGRSIPRRSRSPAVGTT